MQGVEYGNSRHSFSFNVYFSCHLPLVVKMDIKIIRVRNPNCFFCSGKGEYRHIVDHDEDGAVWEDATCGCGYDKVLVDGKELTSLLTTLGYGIELPENS
ncbi:hypothetical protein APT65_00081 [Trabzonvirus APT65]|uniref:Uncharacterized protein n=1 Tax=Aeromonas phage APT65 TaxID=2982914 RepID=A0A9E8GAC9_9CAUD|nr:hypothetical protein APT65_00081 [Aeromonas phage APT65]